MGDHLRIGARFRRRARFEAVVSLWHFLRRGREVRLESVVPALQARREPDLLALRLAAGRLRVRHGGEQRDDRNGVENSLHAVSSLKKEKGDQNCMSARSNWQRTSGLGRFKVRL